jgi:hypothetical protein
MQVGMDAYGIIQDAGYAVAGYEYVRYTDNADDAEVMSVVLSFNQT